MRLICDDNLGKLAAYLRILGFDTSFDEDIDDPALLRKAAEEKRLLITRDRKMRKKSHPYGCLVLEMDDPLQQLSLAARKLRLIVNPDSLFSRCSKCNAICEIVDKENLSAALFPYILKTQEIIKHCPSCGRYYWKGSHYKALLRKLRNAIGDENISGPWPQTV